MLQFFAEYKQFSLIIHVFSVIVGMGGALVSDVLFNVYVKDKRINPTENKTLQVLSKVIWISLGVIVLSGLLIFLSDPTGYAKSEKFLLKVIIVAVLIFNGFLFLKITHKALKKIDFIDTNSHHKYVRIRKASFAFGAVSMVSWLSAFVLGSIQSLPVSLSQAVVLYVLVIIIGIIGSQIAEYFIVRKNSL